MNSKFYDTDIKKQNAIINAALKVFAENGYKKSSTDEIVKEAGISKGLLFHYFGSKLGLYEFIYEYSVRFMAHGLSHIDCGEQLDIFTIYKEVEAARINVMKAYPRMQLFLNHARRESHPDAVEIITDRIAIVEECYQHLYEKADSSMLRKGVEKDRLLSLLSWMSEGILYEYLAEESPDFNKLEEELEYYIGILKEHFTEDPQEPGVEEE